MWALSGARASFARSFIIKSGLKRCAALMALACGCLPIAAANAKTPGTVHCYGGWCHRINTVDEMDAMVGRRGFVQASYYDDCKLDRFNPCGLTSSGAVFRADLPDNAASPIFPDGTVLLTYNPETKLAAVVRVTSAGPYHGDRTLDVSRATAEQLGFLKRGVAPLEVAVLKSPEEHEAHYSKFRIYDTVPGFIGRFQTFDDAHDAAMAGMRLNSASVTAVDSKAALEFFWPRGLAIDTVTQLPDDNAMLPETALEQEAQRALPDIGPEGALSAQLVSEAGFPASTVAIASANSVEQIPSITAWLWDVIDMARNKARLRRELVLDSQISSLY